MVVLLERDVEPEVAPEDEVACFSVISIFIERAGELFLIISPPSSNPIGLEGRSIFILSGIIVLNKLSMFSP